MADTTADEQEHVESDDVKDEHDATSSNPQPLEPDRVEDRAGTAPSDQPRVQSYDVKDIDDAAPSTNQPQLGSQDHHHLDQVIDSLPNMTPEMRRETLKRLEQHCIDSDCLHSSTSSKILVATMEGMARFHYKPNQAFLLKVEELCTTTGFEGFQSSEELLAFLQALTKLMGPSSSSSSPFLRALEDRCHKVDVRQCLPTRACQLSRIIQCMVKLGCRPGRAAILLPFQCGCEVLGFDGFTVHDLAGSLASMVLIGSNPEPSFLNVFVKACLEHGFAAFPISSLCSIVSNLGKLSGGGTGTAFWDRLEDWYLSNNFQGLDDPDPRYLTMVVHAIGQIKHRHPSPAFLMSFMSKCQSIGLHRFDARSLSIIICSLALKSSVLLRPSAPGAAAGGALGTKEAFLRDFVKACESLPLGLGSFDPHHLSVVYHSLIRLGYTPDPSHGWPTSSLPSPPTTTSSSTTTTSDDGASVDDVGVDGGGGGASSSATYLHHHDNDSSSTSSSKRKREGITTTTAAMGTTKLPSSMMKRHKG